jgi:hypothetical protein
MQPMLEQIATDMFDTMKERWTLRLRSNLAVIGFGCRERYSAFPMYVLYHSLQLGAVFLP